MLLTIRTTRAPATDLGFLLHKHPDRVHTKELPFGAATVFYPESSETGCTAALLLDVDPIGLVRGPGGAEDQYVNDRPYVASSLLAVAIARTLASALGGRCEQRPELTAVEFPLEVELAAVPCVDGEPFLQQLFTPLGYDVETIRHPLDDALSFGPSDLFTVTLRATRRLSDVLAHLYVLMPVLDNRKHYRFGSDEVDKLLRKGEGWLDRHPARDVIVARYLQRRRGLIEEALERLTAEEEPRTEDATGHKGDGERAIEHTISLNERRLDAVLAALKASGASRVIDLGCGDGKLLQRLLADRQFAAITGMDVAYRSLEAAQRRLHLDRLAPAQKERIRLLHGSLLYRDARLNDFDAAAVMEVIEHLDPPRLRAFERCIFECARPGTVIVTTPNAEYNAMWPTLPAGQFRHEDHRFEWSRDEFRRWASHVASRTSYQVSFAGIGDEHAELGPPTQMAVFNQ